MSVVHGFPVAGSCGKVAGGASCAGHPANNRDWFHMVMRAVSRPPMRLLPTPIWRATGHSNGGYPLLKLLALEDMVVEVLFHFLEDGQTCCGCRLVRARKPLLLQPSSSLEAALFDLASLLLGNGQAPPRHESPHPLLADPSGSYPLTAGRGDCLALYSYW